jgi:hypothetical protein
VEIEDVAPHRAPRRAPVESGPAPTMNFRQTVPVMRGQPAGNYWLNRKNRCEPEMGLVTVFMPLTTTGAGELLVQNGDTRLVANSTP